MHPEFLKAALRVAGYTAARLADELGVSRSMVTRVLDGKARSKRIEMRIAEVIGKPADELWTRDAKPTLRRDRASSTVAIV
ncbi:helix-turn-helix domain-containing protein [Caballeronia sp. LZ001]|uniref:helix-turn-helix domain-containing protein n=1 Tax=Caballeronia sp. LZ001 TaxID=3038553 RepID=UPI0038D495A8